MEIIELYDEFGKLQKFQLLDTFGMDNDDYAVLLSMDEDDEITYIFKIKKNESEEIILEGIEDEEELNNAVEIYEKLKKENIQ